MSIVSHRPELTEKLIAVTFDDGPSRQTPAILDVLGEHGALATFFVLGERVEGKEEVLGRIMAEGHEVGNHTYSHPHALNLDDGELEHDIGRCQRVLAAAAAGGDAPALRRGSGAHRAPGRPPRDCRPRRFGRSTPRTFWSATRLPSPG